jgi:hypothetical protein
MDAFQPILQKIVENLPLPCFILNNGEVQQANSLLEDLAECKNLIPVNKEVILEEKSLTRCLERLQYNAKKIDLGSYGELVLFVKMNQCLFMYDDLTGLLDRDCFQTISNQLLQQVRLEKKFWR